VLCPLPCSVVSDLAYENDVTGYNTPQTKGNFYGLFDTMVDPRSVTQSISRPALLCNAVCELGQT
jgi:hypothetical protein